jgi:uncharacterized protein (TIGR04222 family)
MTFALLAQVTNPLNLRGEAFLSLYVFAALLAIGLALALRWQARRSPARAKPNAVLDPYEAAYLRESPALAVRAAIANLVSQKALQMAPGGAFARVPGSPYRSGHPLEEAIWLAAAASPAKATVLERRVRPALDGVEASLVEKGLMPDRGARAMASLGTLAVAGVVVFGVIKAVVGVARERPVGFLVALTVGVAIAWAIFYARKVRRTVAGNAALDATRRRYASPSPAAHPSHADAPAPAGMMPAGVYGYDPITMMIALHGVHVLAGHPTLGPMHHALTPPASTSAGDGGSSSDGYADSSSDSSSSDSGSSCSSGCGGCGGGGD